MTPKQCVCICSTYLISVPGRQVHGLCDLAAASGGDVLDVLVLHSQCEAPSVEDRPMIMSSTCAAFHFLCSIEGRGLHQHQWGLLRQSHAHVLVEAQNLHAPNVATTSSDTSVHFLPSSTHRLCKTGAICRSCYGMSCIFTNSIAKNK